MLLIFFNVYPYSASLCQMLCPFKLYNKACYRALQYPNGNSGGGFAYIVAYVYTVALLYCG
jgi:hypothetical protein